jgi:hypothetical protein
LECFHCTNGKQETGVVSVRYCDLLEGLFFIAPFLMDRCLWVKFNPDNAAAVPTEGCANVDDFLRACTRQLVRLGAYDSSLLSSLSMTNGGPALAPYDTVPAQNNGWTPLFLPLQIT